MMPNCFPSNKTQSAENVVLDESLDDPKRVLIVMDALKEFSMELFEWVLKTFTLDKSSRISILGITPYLNIPCKLELHVTCTQWHYLSAVNFVFLCSIRKDVVGYMEHGPRGSRLHIREKWDEKWSQVSESSTTVRSMPKIWGALIFFTTIMSYVSLKSIAFKCSTFFLGGTWDQNRNGASSATTCDRTNQQSACYSCGIW